MTVVQHIVRHRETPRCSTLSRNPMKHHLTCGNTQDLLLFHTTLVKHHSPITFPQVRGLFHLFPYYVGRWRNRSATTSPLQVGPTQ